MAGDRPTDLDDTTLLIGIEEPGADPETMEHLSAGLRDELLSLDVAGVTRPRGDAPADSRAVDMASVSELLVLLGGTVTLISEVIGAVARWRSARPRRKVVLTFRGRVLELDDVTAEQQEDLIARFVREAGER